VCLREHLSCDAVHEEIERLEIRKEEMAYQRRPRCPFGYVEYCDWTMKGCGASRKKPTDEWVCVTPGTLKDAFKGMF